MKSFFLPMLIFGIVLFIAGWFGITINLHTASIADSDFERFTIDFQDANDYDRLFKEALKVYKQSVYLQREYTAFHAVTTCIGIIFIVWTFDRRKILKKLNVLKNKTEMPKETINLSDD